MHANKSGIQLILGCPGLSQLIASPYLFQSWHFNEICQKILPENADGFNWSFMIKYSRLSRSFSFPLKMERCSDTPLPSSSGDFELFEGYVKLIEFKRAVFFYVMVSLGHKGKLQIQYLFQILNS
ncbi:hypothetical protein ABPG72_012581 [Tetrahymena utriculariae]